MIWLTTNPRVDLGYLPGMVSDDDPRPAAAQFAANYQGGWRPFPGMKLGADQTLRYPGDPAMKPLAVTRLRDETILLYEMDWVAASSLTARSKCRGWIECWRST